MYGAMKSGIGMPKIHWYGVDGNYNCMVMDLLGPSIEDMFDFCHRKFTVKTAVMIGFQMV